MRKSRFTESQIITILKAVEAGRTVKDVCCEHGVSEATYYNLDRLHSTNGDLSPVEYEKLAN